MRDLISLLLHSKRHIVDVFVSFFDLSAQKETPHIHRYICIWVQYKVQINHKFPSGVTLGKEK